MSEKVIMGFGEVMLRLSPPGKVRFAQSLPGTLDATFGGGEANVCASIAMLGGKSRYVTVLPENPVAKAFSAQLRAIGVDTDKILFTKEGRMGIYYAEMGACQRPSNVVYDRAGSVIAETGPEGYDFDSILEDVKHLHVTGITPALSEKAFLATREMVKKASEKGIRISCDLNFRKKLWNWKEGFDRKALAAACMGEIVPYADIIIGNEDDAADVFGIKADNSETDSGKLDLAGYEGVARKLSDRFPKASYIAITLRESYSADHNNWGGMLFDCASKKAHFAPLAGDGSYAPYQIHNIVDRFGGGDSFCAGLIFALYSGEYSAPETAIRLAVAASCLKHTIHGDYNYSSLSEVLSLMNGSASGRVQR